MKEPSILARLGALKTANTTELKEMWRKLFETEPPPFNRNYLESRLAYRIQELAHGGLSKEAKKRLKYIAENANARISGMNGDRLMEGTVLVREWRDTQYRVKVLRDGFEYEGGHYRSLSRIARIITGCSWNGPAFFGLRSKAKLI